MGANIASTSVTYQYNSAGDLLSDGLTRYHYDSEGRLDSATTGQGPDAPTTKYAHNALGQRVFKTEPLFSSAATPGTGKNLNNLLADDGEEGEQEPPGLIQQFLNFWSKLWSPSTSDAEKLGWSYVYAEDGSLLGEYGSGGSASSGTSQYLYLPTASGPMPIAAVIKGQTYAIHSDHLNTPRKLTQADGQAAWQWAYSAFGEEQPTTGAKRFTSETTTPTTGATSIPEVTFNLRYPGQYFDSETKLHYNNFRSYDSRTGRYTQGDPIGLDGGFNRFTYVAGDPLNFADDEGLQRRAGGPATLTWGQAQLNFQGVSLTNQIRQYQPNYPYSYASAPGQGFTAANIGQLQSTLQRLQAGSVCTPNPQTGQGYGVNDPPVRIPGVWSNADIISALRGIPPSGLGRPDLHHAGQMPGSAIHEILPYLHRGNTALHPNRYNQGVTTEMRNQDRRLHWWYRVQEQGANQSFPNLVYD